MRAIKFPGSTFDLVKPKDMTDEQCFSLPAADGIDQNGHHYFLVAFEPNYEDLKALQEGRPLYLKVVGQIFQPVALFTLDENGNCNE